MAQNDLIQRKSCKYQMASNGRKWLQTAAPSEVLGILTGSTTAHCFRCQYARLAANRLKRTLGSSLWEPSGARFRKLVLSEAIQVSEFKLLTITRVKPLEFLATLTSPTSEHVQQALSPRWPASCRPRDYARSKMLKTKCSSCSWVENFKIQQLKEVMMSHRY